MTTHLTQTDLESFRARTLGRERVEAIGAHVRECGECARRMWGDARVQQSAGEVWPEEKPHRAWIAWAAAAAVVFVALAAGIWFLREDAPAPRTDPDVKLIARSLRDGSVAITLDGNGAVRDVSTSRVDWNELALAALQRGELPELKRADLIASAAVLRGNGNDAPQVKLLHPVGEVVESNQPEFRWTAVDGARYRIAVARDNDVIATSNLQSAASWTPARPLARGVTYEWQLVVVLHDREWTFPPPDVSPARFAVLSADALRELEAARATGSTLVSGLVAARHGLNDVAQRDLHAFAEKYPEFAPQITKALQERPAPTTTNAYR